MAQVPNDIEDQGMKDKLEDGGDNEVPVGVESSSYQPATRRRLRAKRQTPLSSSQHLGSSRQYWRDIILGVNDGLVSTFCWLLVSPVVACPRTISC